MLESSEEGFYGDHENQMELDAGYCYVALPDTAVYAQVFQWRPVTASGNHTINGNQIVLEGGDQTAMLHFLVSGWDPDSEGGAVGLGPGTDL